MDDHNNENGAFAAKLVIVSENPRTSPSRSSHPELFGKKGVLRNFKVAG